VIRHMDRGDDHSKHPVVSAAGFLVLLRQDYSSTQTRQIIRTLTGETTHSIGSFAGMFYLKTIQTNDECI